jgi:septal ring factor EnvC (AmiA/AmiB activator)
MDGQLRISHPHCWWISTTQGMFMKRLTVQHLGAAAALAMVLPWGAAWAATETGASSGLGAGTSKFIERQEVAIHAMGQVRTQEKSVAATRGQLKTQTKLLKQAREQIESQDKLLARTREQIKDHDKDTPAVKDQLQAQEKTQTQTLEQLKEQDKVLGKTLDELKAQEQLQIKTHDMLKARSAAKPS